MMLIVTLIRFSKKIFFQNNREGRYYWLTHYLLQVQRGKVKENQRWEKLLLLKIGNNWISFELYLQMKYINMH